MFFWSFFCFFYFLIFRFIFFVSRCFSSFSFDFFWTCFLFFSISFGLLDYIFFSIVINCKINKKTKNQTIFMFHNSLQKLCQRKFLLKLATTIQSTLKSSTPFFSFFTPYLKFSQDQSPSGKPLSLPNLNSGRLPARSDICLWGDFLHSFIVKKSIYPPFPAHESLPFQERCALAPFDNSLKSCNKQVGFFRPPYQMFTWDDSETDREGKSCRGLSGGQWDCVCRA